MASVGEVIGIKLNLNGAAEFQVGLEKVSVELQNTQRQAQAAGAGLRGMGAAADDAAEAQRRTLMAMRDSRVEANLLRQANRQLSMQMTDVVTSLASGMPAWMVLIQQGGQIKDSYGGVGAALQGVGGYLRSLINPLTAAGAALAAFAAAGYAGMRQAAELRDALILTGNATGVTAGQFQQLTESVARMSGQSVSGAREILMALVSAGRTSSQVIESQAQAIARIADLSGKAAKDIASAFSDQLDAPLKNAAKLNEQFNFLTMAEYNRIKALTESKRNAEAATLTNELLTKSLADQRSQMGLVERALEGIAKGWGRVKEAVLSVGRPGDEIRDQIAPLERQLQSLRGRLAENQRLGRGDAEIAGLGSLNQSLQAEIMQAEQRLRELYRALDVQNANAAARQQSAADVRRGIAEDQARRSPNNDAARARQSEMDIRAAQDLARLRREDQAQQDADAAARQMLADERKREESYAEWRMQQGDEVARTLIQHEQAVADFLRQQDEARVAELRIRADQQLAAIQRTDQAQAEADATAARAAQERLAADARESLATLQRYDDAVSAAEQAYRQQAAIDARALQERLDADARSSLFLQQRYDDAVNAAEEAYQRQADSFAEYQRTLSDETTRALVADNEALRRFTEQDAAARQRAMDSLGERIGQMRLESDATQLAAEQSISLAEAIELITIARLREMQARMYRPGGEGWREVQAEIDARLELLRLMGDERVRDANLRAAPAAANAWQRTVDQISQSLADGLLNGGMKAGEALKNYFRTLILQPIIRAAVDPIARGITSALGLAGAAGPAAASGGGGGLGGIGSIFSGLSSIGSSIGFIGSGASMTMAGNGMAAFQAAGAAMSGGSIGAGAAIGLGAALPFLALGGILAAGFSRKLKDQGIQGTFGPGGFTGNEFKFYKGGFLTSDKTVLRGLPDDVRVMLSDGFNALRTGTAQMARELGLASESLDTFSKDIKLSFTGLTEEQIQQKLAQELGLVADEMARLVAGSDATADSLRQLYQAVMSERAQLEQRLLQLQGDTTELRRRERENLHETNRALYDRITALEDEQAALEEVKRAAAEAAQALAQQIATLQGELQQSEAQRLSIAQAVVSERTALEQRLLQAQGNTAALRERELQALDPLNRAFARMVFAAEDAAQATAGAAQNLAALAGAGQGISEFVAGLRATGSGNTASLASLRATYNRTLALAQAGDVAASGRITGDARALIDAGLANARTRAEADALAARIATELAALPAAVNYERQQAEALQKLLTHATQVDKAAQDSIDSNTFDTAAEGEKTVAQMRVLVSETVVNSNRLAALNTSIASLTNALTAANEAQRVQREIEALNAQGGTAVQSLASVRGNYSAAYQASAREFVDEMLRAVNPVFGALGLNPWNMRDGSYEGQQRWWDSVNAARQAGDMSRAVQLINEANLQPSGYASPVHLRFPTADAAAAGNTSYSYFGPTAAFNDTLGALNQQLAALKNTSADIDTLRQRVRELGGVPQFAAGGMHTGGLRIVGERGPELEATGPARYWNAADTTAMLGSSQRREELLAAEIRALRAEVAGLRAETRATAENTGKTRRLWERVTRDGESMQVTDVTPAP
jgi:hypothetical protein